MDLNNLTLDRNLLNRKSITTFDEEPISKENLMLIFEAARLAPSSFNTQPWRFIPAAKADKHYHDLLTCLTPKNQTWAKTAPVLILVIAQELHEYNGKPNYYFMHDTGLAFSNLAYQAISLGIYTHPMGGFDHEEARSRFSIPDGYEPILAIAAGYNMEQFSADSKGNPKSNSRKSRKDLNEIVFGADWDKPYFKI